MTKMCGVAECDREHYAHGMCEQHGRNKRAGKPLVKLAPLPVREPCAGPSCDRRRVRSSGLCRAHAEQLRTGVILAPISQYLPTLSERFWQKVVRGKDDECWPWTGTSYGGYGKLTSEQRVQWAHRVSWELANGPVPPGLFVCHRCDNPPCVNPGHLFLGTNQDNMDDMQSKGREARGERMGSAKLTDSDVIDIRTLRGLVKSNAELASWYGIKTKTVGQILRRETWTHLP